MSENVLFLCADDVSAEMVTQRGFRALVLGTDYRDMAAELAGWERLSDEAVWDRAVSGGAACAAGGRDCRPLILVDSYYVTDGYLEGLGRFGTVALMDDLGQKRYPADVVINYNATAGAEDYKKLYRAADVKLLLGSAYAPLREQFQGRNYQVREKVKTVLITTGGGDADNIAGRILEALLDEEREYHIVSGNFNPHFAALKQLADAHGNVHIHRGVADMAGLMLAADIAVTAGGSTIYELAALGVPFICFSCAENQEALTEYIGRYCIAGFAGAFHRDGAETENRLKTLFWEFVSDENLRRQCHRRGKELVDARGAERVARELCRLARLR